MCKKIEVTVKLLRGYYRSTTDKLVYRYSPGFVEASLAATYGLKVGETLFCVLLPKIQPNSLVLSSLSQDNLDSFQNHSYTLLQDQTAQICTKRKQKQTNTSEFQIA